MNDNHLTTRANTAAAAKKTAAAPWLRQLQLVGAVFGLAGSAVVAVLGSGLMAVTWCVRSAAWAAPLSKFGSGLLCLTIPLLVLGACCLDWLEAAELAKHELSEALPEVEARQAVVDETHTRSV